ncbi:hypothetical protein H6P81_011255 [Aristolochia fimbriata]|uniref:Uncharacterized protein n=1 Tax=Aristolochia fimbriata TaxID=158543 RepID=A0AAV7ER18_ARIFI|nr:hypothetical protein H6P81_011255 [Aristolochia fimbriata]
MTQAVKFSQFVGFCNPKHQTRHPRARIIYNHNKIRGNERITKNSAANKWTLIHRPKKRLNRTKLSTGVPKTSRKSAGFIQSPISNGHKRKGNNENPSMLVPNRLAFATDFRHETQKREKERAEEFVGYLRKEAVDWNAVWRRDRLEISPLIPCTVSVTRATGATCRTEKIFALERGKRGERAANRFSFATGTILTTSTGTQKWTGLLTGVPSFSNQSVGLR